MSDALDSWLLPFGFGRLAAALERLRRGVGAATGRPFDADRYDYAALVSLAVDLLAARPDDPAPAAPPEFRVRLGSSGEAPGADAREEVRQLRDQVHALCQQLAELGDRRAACEAEALAARQRADAAEARTTAAVAEAQAERDRADRAAAEALAERESVTRARQDADALRARCLGLIRGVIEARDQLERAGDDDRVTPAQIVAHVLKQTARVCERHGITVLRAEGGPFDPDTQECLDSVATDDPARDLIVQSTARTGYRDGAALLRPQQVLVWRLTTPKTAGGAE